MDENTPAKKMVKLEEADPASLRNFGETVLGLQFAKGTNGVSMRARIKQADVGVTEIPEYVPTGRGSPRKPSPSIARGADAAVAPKAITANGRDISDEGQVTPGAHADPDHYSHDPKVVLQIARDADPTRPRNVDVSVNGVLFRMQRQVEVAVPYRVYSVLKDAREMKAVDSEEINPITNLPKKVWTEVYSYNFQVISMPSDKAIAKWKDSQTKTFQDSRQAA